MRPLRVVLADGGRLQRSDLLFLVERAGWEVVGEAPAWASVIDLASSKAADLVLISGDADYASHARECLYPTVAIIPDAISAKEFAGSGAFAIVPIDAEGDVVSAMGEVAVARAADLAEARKQADQLRDQLETRKLVERAKGVLMRRLGVSEDEAYRKMQRASQDENRKLRDIADSILAAERLYGDKQKG
jgi:response regulator NasT